MQPATRTATAVRRRSRGSTSTDVRSADFAALYSASFRCAYGDIAGDMRQALQAFVAMSLIYKRPTPVGAPLASPLIRGASHCLNAGEPVHRAPQHATSSTTTANLVSDKRTAETGFPEESVRIQSGVNKLHLLWLVRKVFVAGFLDSRKPVPPLRIDLRITIIVDQANSARG